MEIYLQGRTIKRMSLVATRYCIRGTPLLRSYYSVPPPLCTIQIKCQPNGVWTGPMGRPIAGGVMEGADASSVFFLLLVEGI